MAAVLVWMALSAQEAAKETPTAVLPAYESTGAALVPNAVTVEGTAAVEVVADVVRFEFKIAARGGSAADALAQLKNTSARFETAITNATGGRTLYRYTNPVVEKVGPPAGSYYQATQTAIARQTDYPREARDFEYLVVKVASAAFDGGISTQAGPRIVFEVLEPLVFERRLAEEAFADSKRRAEMIRGVLKRSVGEMKSGYFSTAVTVNGGTLSLSKFGQTIESDTMTVVIKYTVQVAYSLGV